MSEPEFDRKDKPNSSIGPDSVLDSDSESMFDFLAEDGDRARAGQVRRGGADQTGRAESPLPIIRKPVPVSKSGPLLPPKPGDPVEPPPQLTISKGDDFDFLDEEAPTRLRQSDAVNTGQQANVTRLKPENKQRRSAGLQQPTNQQHLDDDATSQYPTSRVPAARQAPASNDHTIRTNELAFESHDSILDDFDLADDLDFDQDWRSGVHTNISSDVEPHRSSGRKYLFVAAVLLIVAGLASFAWTQRQQWWPVQKVADAEASVPTDEAETGPTLSGLQSPGEVRLPELATNAESTENAEPSTAFNVSPSPLMQRFRDQLASLETLVGEGSLDEAEQVLATMDRTVYGYGAFEFGELENRIAAIRRGEPLDSVDSPIASSDQSPVGIEQQSQPNADPLRLEQERLAREAAAADAQRLEQERLAQEAAAADAQRLEQERLAQEAAAAEAQRLEQERLAQEAEAADAQRLEQERLAQEAAAVDAQRLEQERLAQEAAAAEAQRLEQERLAQEAAAADAQRLEQERLAQEAAAADAQRLEQERVAQETAAADARRLEQERLAREAAAAEAQRLEQERLAQQQSENSVGQNWQRVDVDRQATDRQIAEQRAAAQREAARQQRLAEARERAAARAAERPQTESISQVATAVVPALSEPSPPSSSTQQAVNGYQTITDDDLQFVYQRFSSLQQAVNTRDINKVIELTERSGTRIQQFLQMFENSVSVDSRIRNVSTRNAAGEIHGTLQINGVTRADGSVIRPPASIASVSLTSSRSGDGWSAIRW